MIIMQRETDEPTTLLEHFILLTEMKKIYIYIIIYIYIYIYKDRVELSNTIKQLEVMDV